MDTGARTQLLFELVGTHFVDVFINHLYKTAKKVAATNGETVTAAYQRATSAYATAIKSDGAAYLQTVKLVHQHVRSQTEIGVDFAGFVDRIVGSLVPPKYLRSMQDNQKDEIMSDFLCNLISGLAVYATTTEHLREIIDHRVDRHRGLQAVRKMQDHAVHLLNADQERLYNKFLGLDSQAKHGASAELVSKMKGAIRQLALEKEQLGERLQRAEAEKVRWELKYKKAKSKNAALVKAVESVRLRHAGPGAGVARPEPVWPPQQVWPSTEPTQPAASAPAWAPPPAASLPPPAASAPPPPAATRPPGPASPETEPPAFSLASAVGPVEESDSDSSGVDDEDSGSFK
jgi:hypothetical protein